MKCRGFTTGWKRAAVTAAVVYALVLQGLLLSLGGALHAVEAAAGPQTIICAEGSATGQDRAPVKAHDALCCTLSCHGSTAAGPLPVFAVLKRRTPAVLEIRAAGKPAVLRVASHVLPLGSRAPPRLG